MKSVVFLGLIFFLPAILCAQIPSEQDIVDFLADLNTPLALTASGGIYNSSCNLAGIPHFNIDAGITSIGATIKDPVGQGDLNATISFFHVKATIGLLEGFNPAPLWKGLMGFEAGIKGFTSPLLGALYKHADGYPYGFGLLAKLNLLKEEGTIPAISFTFEYNSLLNTDFSFIDYATNTRASCSLTQSSFYYHLDLREKLGVVYVYTGIGWVMPSTDAEYTIDENEGAFTSESISLSKYHFGLSIPIDLVDVNLEVGQSESKSFFGASLGFKM